MKLNYDDVKEQADRHPDNIRDEFLTISMGSKWHDFHYGDGFWCCLTCKVEESEDHYASVYHQNKDFSTWNGFGVLYPWARKQGWFFDMKFWSDIKGNTQYAIADEMIEPELFANLVYSYLKRKEIGCLSSKL